jgi:hypothetical protein
MDIFYKAVPGLIYFLWPCEACWCKAQTKFTWPLWTGLFPLFSGNVQRANHIEPDKPVYVRRYMCQQDKSEASYFYWNDIFTKIYMFISIKCYRFKQHFTYIQIFGEKVSLNYMFMSCCGMLSALDAWTDVSIAQSNLPCIFPCHVRLHFIAMSGYYY